MTGDLITAYEKAAQWEDWELEALAEYRSEEAKELLVWHVAKLVEARQTHLHTDWIIAGILYERYTRAAMAANINKGTPP